MVGGYNTGMRACWLSLVSFLTLVCVAPSQASAALTATLAAAGENSAQLEQALIFVPAEQRAAMEFLLEHMPASDATKLSAKFLLREVEAAHGARKAVSWGAELSDELFLNYVVPYAQADERREDWRTGFGHQFLPLVTACKTPGEAARKLNETIFDLVKVHYSTGRKRALQSPSESIEQSIATCTGLSILLADACRACCVPARIVSVKWPHKAGNHTWVEVWDGERWRFCGADEPDPKGLDRAWFTGDARQCADADREHRIWAVSFAATGERFQPGWGRNNELWGVDVTARYGSPKGDPVIDDVTTTTLAAPLSVAFQDEALAAQLDRWFAADEKRRATFEFDRNLDAKLRTVAGDTELRAAVFAAWKRSERKTLLADHEQSRVRAGGKESPFTQKQVGDKPAAGWPLVIAMHGGGGVPKRINDSQWRHMQIYYKDHPEAGGYLYCALRAPTDDWNGFYTDYFYPVIEKLIRQFVACGDVDPDRVIAIGYSHGGYGAFAVGPKLPHRFAAVHASAAAPSDGQSLPVGLHTLPFSFMVGGKDNAYGRRERCVKFAASLDALKQEHAGLYPTTFTLVEGNGHTGLPDRDLLPQLLPHRRTATPKVLRWQLSDGVVRDHYWLRVGNPQSGQHLVAELTDTGLEVTTAGPAAAAELWLDARLCRFDRPLRITVDGKSREVALAPSLRTLCATMLDRGDPGLAASQILPLLE